MAAILANCDQYLHERLTLLEAQLTAVNRMASIDGLPDAIIHETTGLKVTPFETAVPAAAQALIDHATAALPHVKITELLMQVDDWTGFTRHFVT